MRLKRTSAPALLLVAAALIAGCGGSEVAPDEVPGGPVSLTVPEDQQLGGSGSDSADSSQDSDATANDGTTDDAASADGTTTDPSATTDDTSGGTTAPAPATGGGTAAPDAGTTTPPTDDPAAAPDTGGTGGTSEFCEQNAGAC